jgi:hypothetical protein
VQTLMDTATGSYVVTTQSSTYVVDLDAMVVSRSPGQHTWVVTTMRKDGAELPLLFLDDCTVGRPLTMIVDLEIPGCPWTLRAATAVQSIQTDPACEEYGRDDRG